MIDSRPYMWLIAGCIMLGVILVCGVATLAVSSDRTFSYDIRQLADLHGDQCEKPRSKSSVVEPANAWSNLAYMLAGILILLRARSLPGILFGANLCALALFSGFYHATLKGLPQIMDVAWVYAALFSAILFGVYTLLRAFGVELWWWLWTILVIFLDILGLLIRRSFGWDSTVVFIVLVVLMTLILIGIIITSAVQGKVARQFGADYGWWYLSLELLGVAAIAGVGFMFRLGDGYAKDSRGNIVENFLCNPDSIVQSHALWHILSAAALLLAYDLFTQFQSGNDIARPDQPTVLPSLSSS